MKPKYAVIDEYKRDRFEKEWQLPYGYSKCFITHNPQIAINHLNKLADKHGEKFVSTFIVERVSEEGREIYYRI